MKKLLTFLTLLTLSIGVSWAADQTIIVDFESQAFPTGWTNSNFEVVSNPVSSNSNNYAASTGGKTSATLTYDTKLTGVKSISVDATRTSNNTNSNLYIQYSTDNTNWIDAKQVTITKNSWTTTTYSFDNATSCYVRICWKGTTAVKYIDNIVITYDSDAGSQTTVGIPVIIFDAFTAGKTTSTVTITPGENATSTSYKIGDGTYQTYSAPIEIDLTEVASPITVYAKSSDGTNESSEVSATFTVPALGLSISPASYDGYAAQPVTITPSNYVGDYAITYTINGGNDIDYSAPFTLSDPGTYEIVANVIDERKNAVEATNTSTITIREAQGIELPFIETFDDFAATQGGGNDNNFGAAGTVQINTNTDQADNEGWVYNAVYPALNCVKIGKSDGGSATTPTITGLTVGNTYTLTFKAAPWGNDGTTLNLSATGADLSESSVTMATGTWTEFTITLTATATSTSITFTPERRCFLDEINVKEPVIADGYYLYGTFNGWNTKDAKYKFTEDNGNYVLNDVDLPANVRFKISKVENGQVTEYGGSGDSDYGIHRDWHTHIDMKGVQAYTIAGAALTNFILHPDADINNMYFEVERVPQLYFKCDKINNWANNPMSQVNGVWTYSGELEAGAKFGFNDEWGDHHGYNWTVNPEHYGNAYDIPVATADTYTMRDAGNYKLDVNSDLTVLHVNKVFNINCSAKPNGGGTVVAKVNDQTVTSAMSGETVTIEYTTNNGYTFSNISLNGNVLEAVDGVYSFVMSTQDAEVVANYTASSYNITVESDPDDFGTVTCPTTATTGQTVTFTVTPDEGYSVKSVTAHFVNGENNTPVNVSYNEDTEEYSFGMPPFPVTVTVTYKVPLQPCTIRFEETWNETNGMGGNDGNWNGIQQTDPIVNDNEGWIYMRNGEYVEGFNGYGANKCIRIGDGNNTGSATTPEIIVTNGTIYKMTFKAGSWDSNVEALLSATGAELYSDESCTTTPVSSIALPYRSWGAEGEQEHVVYVKATSSLMTITWSTTAAKKRFFLDEVVIDFFETPLPTELTLAQIITLGDEADGKLYKISDTDGLLGVYSQGTSVWFKDEAQAVDYQEPQASDKDYAIVINEKDLKINKNQKDFAQNNWIEVVFPAEANYNNKYVKNLTGTYSNVNGNPVCTDSVGSLGR